MRTDNTDNVLLPERLRELHLFAGAGGGILGGMLLGHHPVCAVEIEPYARGVLIQRQRDGVLPRFPVWDNVSTFDGRPWRGRADIVCGGFPCQDVTSAQLNPDKRRGIHGQRTGLVREMLRIIGEVRPRFVLAENSPKLRGRGLADILQGLAGLGYDAVWGVVGANNAGAPHLRKRLWILAHGPGERLPVPAEVGAVAGGGSCQQDQCGAGEAWGAWWSAEPGLARVAHGVADRVERTRATGNGQVPAVVALAWEALTSSIRDLTTR